MTTQIPDKIFLDGERCSLLCEPLYGYLSSIRPRVKFKFQSTGLLRGYIGSWEIFDDRLYLTGLNAKRVDTHEDVTLTDFFPESPNRVFAEWYSGKLKIGQGGIIKFRPGIYGQKFERELFLDIIKGLVTNKQTIHNEVEVDNILKPDSIPDFLKIRKI